MQTMRPEELTDVLANRNFEQEEFSDVIPL